MSRSMHKRGLVTHTNPKSAVSEAFRSLRTSMEFSGRSGELKTIVITSSVAGEGKSTTAANIAVAYAQASRKVLLIDADLRTPVQHQLFELSDRYGLSTALTKGGEIDEVVQHTGIDNLRVLCAGPIPPNPSELLDSSSMDALLQAARQSFDIVILDTPAMMSFADALIAAGKSDGVVLVVKPGKVKNETALKAKQALELGKANVIGAVLNPVGR